MLSASTEELNATAQLGMITPSVTLAYVESSPVTARRTVSDQHGVAVRSVGWLRWGLGLGQPLVS